MFFLTPNQQCHSTEGSVQTVKETEKEKSLSPTSGLDLPFHLLPAVCWGKMHCYIYCGSLAAVPHSENAHSLIHGCIELWLVTVAVSESNTLALSAWHIVSVTHCHHDTLSSWHTVTVTHCQHDYVSTWDCRMSQSGSHTCVVVFNAVSGLRSVEVMIGWAFVIWCYPVC